MLFHSGMAPPIDILLPGSGRDTAVLLLHGLTGTPLEMRTLGEQLSQEGYTVHIPLLPGRGTRPDDMDRLCWEDWMRAALHSYDVLARDHQRVVVGGVSAGGTMALDVALRRDPAALLLYATVLQIGHRGAYLAPYFWRVVRRWPSPPSDMVEPNDELRCYNPAPVRAMAELISGIARVRPHLGKIQAPAFVAHSPADMMVPVSCMTELQMRLGGPVETMLVNGSGHSVTCDARRYEVAHASRTFVKRYLAVRELRSA